MKLPHMRNRLLRYIISTSTTSSYIIESNVIVLKPLCMHKAYGTFIFLNLFDCFWRTKCKILKQYLPSMLVFWLSCCRLLVGKKKNTWEIDLFCTLGIDQGSYPCRFVTGDLDTRSRFQNFIFSMYSFSLHNKDMQSLNSPTLVLLIDVQSK